jgi:hypothetical protein
MLNHANKPFPHKSLKSIIKCNNEFKYLNTHFKNIVLEHCTAMNELLPLKSVSLSVRI